MVNKEHAGGVLRVVFTAAYICTSYYIFYSSSSMWAYSIVSASAARTMVMQRRAGSSVMTGTVSTILRVKTTQVLSEEGC
jgi:hypothetical protein